MWAQVHGSPGTPADGKAASNGRLVSKLRARPAMAAGGWQQFLMTAPGTSPVFLMSVTAYFDRLPVHQRDFRDMKSAV
jgi:hypothetical protein